MAIDTYISVTLGNLPVSAGTHPGHGSRPASGATVGDVVLCYDKTKVASMNVLREAVTAALFQVQSGNTLTA